MIGVITLISVVIFLDQIIKSKARNELEEKVEVNDYISLKLVKNKGSFKGLFKERPQFLLILQTVCTSIVVIITLISLFKSKDKLLKYAFALLSGGAIGNLIDRYKFGEVTDYIAFKWTKNLYYNLADFCIFVGAIVIAIKGRL